MILNSPIRRVKKKIIRKKRRHWVRPGRNNIWWKNIISGISLQDEWRENFRVSRETFDYLCNELRPFLQKKETHLRKPVSVETQVAVTLYYLSDEGRLRKVTNAFGLGSKKHCIDDYSAGNTCDFILHWTEIHQTTEQCTRCRD